MRGKTFVVAGLMALWAPAVAEAVVMNWVPVGNPGNAGDATTGYGAVGYNYKIGKYEVTNSQYAEFLNAKAASDPYDLYDTNMSSDVHGGINRSGSSGSYSYSVKSGYANMPVVFVNWYDSIRFANWMNNGQGNGDTETGAYSVYGIAVPTVTLGATITRNPEATVFLTSEDEWYKAAYHQPAAAGGDSDNYWLYATRTNIVPTAQAPPGGSNSANYNNVVGALTEVGAYVNSPSYYGTFDQAGNAFEWNESFIFGTRGLRGGSWEEYSAFFPAYYLGADLRYSGSAELGYNNVGFRLASIPEPTSGVMLLIVGAIALGRTKAR